MSAEITTLSSVAAHYECPSCDRHSLTRASRDTNIISRDQIPLWDLEERCTMCSWELTTPNVKIGV